MEGGETEGAGVQEGEGWREDSGRRNLLIELSKTREVSMIDRIAIWNTQRT